jgi:DNA polymerase-3 subunit beta
MVATDGRRLAIATAPLEHPPETECRAVVPTKGMQLFTRAISDPTEMVSIHFGESQIGLKTAKAEIFARLIDGEFPRYSAVIPSSTENLIEADAQMLGQKLRLVSNVTTSDMRAVKLSFKKGQMTVFGRSAAAGEATAHMEVVFKGKACDIAFNPDYIIDGLKNCELETVRLEFSERTSPGKFTLGENYIYIVMPITIDT